MKLAWRTQAVERDRLPQTQAFLAKIIDGSLSAATSFYACRKSMCLRSAMSGIFLGAPPSAKRRLREMAGFNPLWPIDKIEEQSS